MATPGWLTDLAKKYHAVHMLGVPRSEWHGGKLDEDTLSLSSSGGHWIGHKDEVAKRGSRPWLVMVGPPSAPDAILCLEKPLESLAKAQPHPKGTKLIHDFRVVWKRQPPEQESTQSGVQLPVIPPSTPPQVMSVEERKLEYRQLLADAELILYAANHTSSLVPMTFLAPALTRWNTMSVWLGMRDHQLVDVTDPRHLRLEFVLGHLRQAQALALRPKRAGAAAAASAVVEVRVKLREWWAAVAAIPWKPTPQSLSDPDPGNDESGFCMLRKDQRDLFLVPYRRVRALQMTQEKWPVWGGSGGGGTMASPLDDLLRQAMPHLAQAVRQRLDATQMTTIGKEGQRNTPLQRSSVFEKCAQIRRQVKELAELADYLPPCMTAVRTHGLATQHLFYSDRYYASAFLAGLGQGEAGREPLPVGIPASFSDAGAATAAIDEGCRFFINDSIQPTTGRITATAADLADMMGDIFYPRRSGADRPIWSCSNLRKRQQEGKITSGSAVHCPYSNSDQCLKAADMANKTDEPMIFPAQFTLRALKKKNRTEASAGEAKM